MPKHQQQKIWRKAANCILSLPYNLGILIAFSLIFLLTIQWLAIESQLRKQLQPQTAQVALQLVSYSREDLIDAVQDNNVELAQKVLDKLVNHELIAGATVYNQLGISIASAELDTQPNTLQTILYDLNPEQAIGTLKLMIDENYFHRDLAQSLNRLSMISLLLLVLAIASSVLITRKILAPITKLLNFPLEDPDELAIENLDIGTELKQLLETSSSNYSAPAPVSTAEDAGIHHLLATDSVGNLAQVVCLQLNLTNFANWITPESGTPNIYQLRTLDKILILTIHSQQGHLLSFKGQSAEACFGLDGDLDNAPYRAICCAYMLIELLAEIGLECQFMIRSEQRLLIHHQKRTPVAIAIEPLTDSEPEVSGKILIDQTLFANPLIQQQFECEQSDGPWCTINQPSINAQGLLERQLSWIRYLLES